LALRSPARRLLSAGAMVDAGLPSPQPPGPPGPPQPGGGGRGRGCGGAGEGDGASGRLPPLHFGLLSGTAEICDPATQVAGVEADDSAAAAGSGAAPNSASSSSLALVAALQSPPSPWARGTGSPVSSIGGTLLSMVRHRLSGAGDRVERALRSTRDVRDGLQAQEGRLGGLRWVLDQYEESCGSSGTGSDCTAALQRSAPALPPGPGASTSSCASCTEEAEDSWAYRQLDAGSSTPREMQSVETLVREMLHLRELASRSERATCEVRDARAGLERFCSESAVAIGGDAVGSSLKLSPSWPGGGRYSGATTPVALTDCEAPAESEAVRRLERQVHDIRKDLASSVAGLRAEVLRLSLGGGEEGASFEQARDLALLREELDALKAGRGGAGAAPEEEEHLAHVGEQLMRWLRQEIVEATDELRAEALEWRPRLENALREQAEIRRTLDALREEDAVLSGGRRHRLSSFLEEDQDNGESPSGNYMAEPQKDSTAPTALHVEQLVRSLRQEIAESMDELRHEDVAARAMTRQELAEVSEAIMEELAGLAEKVACGEGAFAAADFAGARADLDSVIEDIGILKARGVHLNEQSRAETEFLVQKCHEIDLEISALKERCARIQEEAKTDSKAVAQHCVEIHQECVSHRANGARQHPDVGVDQRNSAMTWAEHEEALRAMAGTGATAKRDCALAVATDCEASRDECATLRHEVSELANTMQHVINQLGLELSLLSPVMSPATPQHKCGSGEPPNPFSSLEDPGDTTVKMSGMRTRLGTTASAVSAREVKQEIADLSTYQAPEQIAAASGVAAAMRAVAESSAARQDCAVLHDELVELKSQFATDGLVASTDVAMKAVSNPSSAKQECQNLRSELMDAIASLKRDLSRLTEEIFAKHDSIVGGSATAERSSAKAVAESAAAREDCAILRNDLICFKAQVAETVAACKDCAALRDEVIDLKALVVRNSSPVERDSVMKAFAENSSSKQDCQDLRRELSEATASLRAELHRVADNLFAKKTVVVDGASIAKEVLAEAVVESANAMDDCKALQEEVAELSTTATDHHSEPPSRNTKKTGRQGSMSCRCDLELKDENGIAATPTIRVSSRAKLQGLMEDLANMANTEPNAVSFVDTIVDARKEIVDLQEDMSIVQAQSREHIEEVLPAMKDDLNELREDLWLEILGMNAQIVSEHTALARAAETASKALEESSSAKEHCQEVRQQLIQACESLREECPRVEDHRRLRREFLRFSKSLRSELSRIVACMVAKCGGFVGGPSLASKSLAEELHKEISEITTSTMEKGDPPVLELDPSADTESSCSASSTVSLRDWEVSTNRRASRASVVRLKANLAQVDRPDTHTQVLVDTLADTQREIDELQADMNLIESHARESLEELEDALPEVKDDLKELRQDIWRDLVRLDAHFTAEQELNASRAAKVTEAIVGSSAAKRECIALRSELEALIRATDANNVMLVGGVAAVVAVLEQLGLPKKDFDALCLALTDLSIKATDAGTPTAAVLEEVSGVAATSDEEPQSASADRSVGGMAHRLNSRAASRMLRAFGSSENLGATNSAEGITVDAGAAEAPGAAAEEARNSAVKRLSSSTSPAVVGVAHLPTKVALDPLGGVAVGGMAAEKDCVGGAAQWRDENLLRPFCAEDAAQLREQLRSEIGALAGRVAENERTLRDTAEGIDSLSTGIRRLESDVHVLRTQLDGPTDGATEDLSMPEVGLRAKVDRLLLDSQRAQGELACLRERVSVIDEKIRDEIDNVEFCYEGVMRIEEEVKRAQSRLDALGTGHGLEGDTQLMEMFRAIRRDQDYEQSAHQRVLARLGELCDRIGEIEADGASEGESAAGRGGDPGVSETEAVGGGGGGVGVERASTQAGTPTTVVLDLRPDRARPSHLTEAMLQLRDRGGQLAGDTSARLSTDSSPPTVYSAGTPLPRGLRAGAGPRDTTMSVDDFLLDG